jgi:biopolymer transport protein TolR
MGMASGGASGGGGRRRRGRQGALLVEINMTPFIDVMLVLLIIFMVAAPLLTAGVPLDLPQTKAGALNVEQKPLTVSIDDHGGVFLQDKPVAVADLVAALTASAKQGVDERIYVRGAKQAQYGAVAEVMGVLTQAGFKKIALITEPERK